MMRLRRGALVVTILLAAAAALVQPAAATPPPVAPPPPAEASGEPNPNGTPNPNATVTPAPSIFASLRRRSQLLGTLDGIRPAIAKYGISFYASETSEELGNVAGGQQQGFDYDGLLQMNVQLDTQRAFGLYGGTLNVSALNIHGSSLSANNLLSLETASGIESDRASRVWELWYDQQLSRSNTFDVKIGQQSLDQEFIANQNASLFVNTMFGWPMLPSADLPGGGPAYPLSALGVRFRARPTQSLAILGGVFNGSPSATNDGDSQQLDPSGLSFPLNGGVLAIGEIQYTYPALGGIVYADKPEPLARTIKLGMFYDSENFEDQAVDTAGVPLVSARTNGIPRNHQGNYAFYATIDQLLAQDANDPYRTVNGFARAMGTPLGAQNLIAFSMNAGLTLHEPIKLRRDDTLGIGMGFTKVGSGAAAADAYAGQTQATPYPIRNSEAYVELTYQYALFPWIAIQPDFQYTINPGAGILNPNNPLQRIGNEPVIGVRTIIQL
jgi:porin